MHSTLLDEYTSCFSYKPNCEEVSSTDHDITDNVQMDVSQAAIVYETQTVPEHPETSQNEVQRTRFSFEVLKLVDNRYFQPNFFCPILHDDVETDGIVFEKKDDTEIVNLPRLLPFRKLVRVTEVTRVSDRKANCHIPLHLINNNFSQLNFFLPKVQYVNAIHSS